MTRADELEQMYATLANKLGKGTGYPITQQPRQVLPRFSTGSVNIDWALGGGIPQGRIIEFYGQESSAKTSIALGVVASVQQVGLRAAFVDAEQSFDPDWARLLGVDPDAVPFIQPDCGEEALDAVEIMVRSEAVQLIVVDSVAALVPKAEVEGEMGLSHMGLQARLMSQACRKLTPLCARHNCTVLFINQLREKIGVMFGSPETTTGGKALKFYASIRCDLRAAEAIKRGEEQIGFWINFKVPKNKTAPPKRKVKVPFLYSMGIDAAREVLELAVDAKLVEKNGSWYSYDSTKLGQGENAATTTIRDNPDLLDQLRARVLALMLETT